MRWLLFLSRLAFICGVFLLAALSLRISNWTKDDALISTIIITGYFMGLILLPLTSLCFLIVLIFKRKLKGIVPLWLATADFLFLLVLLYYIFILNYDPQYS